MTFQNPMFPPRADGVGIAPDSTCSDTAPVETGAATAPVFTCSDTEKVSGAATEPFLGGPVEGPPNLYLPTKMTPEELFRALGRIRSEAEAAVERLIALIDALDGDADAEPAGDELDGDADDELTGDECEPSLGAPENHPRQTLMLRSTKQFRDSGGDQCAWAGGNDDEREGDAGHDDREGDELEHGGDEHDGREPDTHDEPSLGWTASEAASGRYGGAWFANNDLEIDTDTGIGDRDGLMEQCSHAFDRSNVYVI